MDETIEELRNMTRNLLTVEEPEVTVTIGETKYHFQGSDARTFGCGMQVVLKAIGHEAN